MSWTLLSSRGRELGHQFSGHPSAVLHLDALRLAARGLQCRLPVAGVLRPPGLAAGHRPGPSCRARAAPAHPAAPGMPGVQADLLLGALRPEADGAVTSASLLRGDRKGAGGQDGVSDSDPRTLAEYVRQCPKIFVR